MRQERSVRCSIERVDRHFEFRQRNILCHHDDGQDRGAHGIVVQIAVVRHEGMEIQMLRNGMMVVAGLRAVGFSVVSVMVVAMMRVRRRRVVCREVAKIGMAMGRKLNEVRDRQHQGEAQRAVVT